MVAKSGMGSRAAVSAGISQAVGRSCFRAACAAERLRALRPASMAVSSGSSSPVRDRSFAAAPMSPAPARADSTSRSAGMSSTCRSVPYQQAGWAAPAIRSARGGPSPASAAIGSRQTAQPRFHGAHETHVAARVFGECGEDVDRDGRVAGGPEPPGPDTGQMTSCRICRCFLVRSPPVFTWVPAGSQPDELLSGSDHRGSADATAAARSQWKRGMDAQKRRAPGGNGQRPTHSGLRTHRQVRCC
jgi:hypothetical protein